MLSLCLDVLSQQQSTILMYVFQPIYATQWAYAIYVSCVPQNFTVIAHPWRESDCLFLDHYSSTGAD